MIADIRLAGAIVVHDECILIVRRSNKEKFLPGVWGVPCGKLEPGESPDDAVLRELYEETGLRGEVVSYVGKLTFKSRCMGRELHNVQDNYRIRLPYPVGVMPDVDLPELDQEAKWVRAEALSECQLDAHNLAAIRQGLSVAQPA